MGTVNKSPPGKVLSTRGWKRIRLNLNLFEYKSPLTAGKGPLAQQALRAGRGKRNFSKRSAQQLFLVWDRRGERSRDVGTEYLSHSK